MTESSADGRPCCRREPKIIKHWSMLPYSFPKVAARTVVMIDILVTILGLICMLHRDTGPFQLLYINSLKPGLIVCQMRSEQKSLEMMKK